MKGCSAASRSKPGLLALVEQADGALALLAGDVHALHQRLDHADFGLADPAVGLAEVAERREQRVEKHLLRAVDADEAGDEAVDHVTQQHADQRAAEAALEQAQHAADDLAPPVPGDGEGFAVRHGSLAAC